MLGFKGVIHEGEEHDTANRDITIVKACGEDIPQLVLSVIFLFNDKCTASD